MNTVADETIYRIRQDAKLGYRDYHIKTQQMLDDINFLLEENKLRETMNYFEIKNLNNKINTLEDGISDLNNEIDGYIDNQKRLVKLIVKHIVNLPEWVEEIADEYGIELE